MDYSENLKEKPKLEVQSHHFSGEQHSLHSAVAHMLEGNKYFFHFSDEKKHDWRFTKAVFSNLETIRLKSDNCGEQYKCRKIFGMYKELAINLRKRIILYYGASAHGRGLVDGMSSSGVKTTLRKEIIVADFYCIRTGTVISSEGIPYRKKKVHRNKNGRNWKLCTS